MSLPRAVAPVPAPAGAPPLQRRAQDPATPVDTGDVGQCPRTKPDPPTSCGTHSCQTSSTIHSNASTCPRPACTLPARTTAPLCTANAVAAPGPLRPGLPALTPTPLLLRHPRAHHAPHRHPSPQKGATGPPPARGTDGRQLLQNHAWTEERCPEPPGAEGDAVGSTGVPSQLAGASPSCRPARPRRCSTRVRGPAAVPVPRRKRPSHAPAPLRPALAPCLPPALPASLPARHRHSFRQEPDSQHPCPAPPRLAAPAGGSRQEHAAAAAGSGGGQPAPAWPGTPRTQKSTSTFVRVAGRAGSAGRPGQGRAATPPSPREALPFRTEKGYCMTRDGDASRPAAAPALSRAARSERPGT